MSLLSGISCSMSANVSQLLNRDDRNFASFHVTLDNLCRVFVELKLVLFTCLLSQYQLQKKRNCGKRKFECGYTKRASLICFLLVLESHFAIGEVRNIVTIFSSENSLPSRGCCTKQISQRVRLPLEELSNSNSITESKAKDTNFFQLSLERGSAINAFISGREQY